MFPWGLEFSSVFVEGGLGVLRGSRGYISGAFEPTSLQPHSPLTIKTAGFGEHCIRV